MLRTNRQRAAIMAVMMTMMMRVGMCSSKVHSSKAPHTSTNFILDLRAFVKQSRRLPAGPILSGPEYWMKFLLVR